MDALDPTALPDSVQAIVETIGLDATLRLVERYGGVRLWVPAQLSDRNGGPALIELLGEQAARALVHSFAGEPLAVPRCVRALRQARDARIRAQRATGTPVHRLAREHGLTERQVYNLLAVSPSANDSQGSLL